MCWHKWAKWEQYIISGTIQSNPFSRDMIPYTEKRQKRHCLKCNKEQDEIVN